MNLRNKKTGETGYYLHTHRDHNTGTLKVAVLKDGVPFSEFKPHEPIYDYDSLSELNADWEDYKPKEPLIKDEKIRKAVRAWAEANDVLEVFIDNIGDGTYMELYDEDDGRRRISALRPAGLKTREAYTIDELCGEEEK